MTKIAKITKISSPTIPYILENNQNNFQPTCSSICTRSQHIMNPISVKHKSRIRNVEFPRRLRQAQSFLEYGKNRLRHSLRPPWFQRTPLSEPQIVNQALVCVPTFLPHGLQLVLVTVCWNKEMEKGNINYIAFKSQTFFFQQNYSD